MLNTNANDNKAVITNVSPVLQAEYFKKDPLKVINVHEYATRHGFRDAFQDELTDFSNII